MLASCGRRLSHRNRHHSTTNNAHVAGNAGRGARRCQGTGSRPTMKQGMHGGLPSVATCLRGPDPAAGGAAAAWGCMSRSMGSAQACEAVVILHCKAVIKRLPASARISVEWGATPSVNLAAVTSAQRAQHAHWHQTVPPADARHGQALRPAELILRHSLGAVARARRRLSRSLAQHLGRGTTTGSDLPTRVASELLLLLRRVPWRGPWWIREFGKKILASGAGSLAMWCSAAGSRAVGDSPAPQT